MAEVMEWRSKKEFDNLSERVNILQTDLANFVGAILQAGIVELVKDEQGDGNNEHTDNLNNSNSSNSVEVQMLEKFK